MAAALRGASLCSRAIYRYSLIGSASSSIRLPSQLISNRGIASKLFVGGLSFFTSEITLSEAFSKFGQVVDATIVMDRVSDRSRGFGFVTFASEDEALDALERMNGKVLNGRVIFVNIAKLKQISHPMPIPRGPPDPPNTE